jgi:hypothetical protein
MFRPGAARLERAQKKLRPVRTRLATLDRRMGAEAMAVLRPHASTTI